MPRVMTLGRAELTTLQYVLEGSWAGAESTPNFTPPLMEVSWCWKDVISCSDDKAELLRFHAPQILPANPPHLHPISPCPLSLFTKGDWPGPPYCFPLFVYFPLPPSSSTLMLGGCSILDISLLIQGLLFHAEHAPQCPYV